jgi:monoamine oxidase
MKEVVIIGGGIAGLAAATELLRNDCAVTILEAKDRLGGRINTIHNGALPIELGAEFLHGQSETILTVLRAAELSTHDVPDHNQIFEDGKLHRVKLWNKVSKLIHQINPRAADCSFSEFLAKQKLSERERQIAVGFVNGFHAARTDRISAHSLLRGEVAAEKMQGTTQSRINAGYSALIDFLEQDVRAHGGKILTGVSVKQIRWRRRRVELETCSNQKFTAGAAVVALPLGVLKVGTVKFDPPLEEKQEAINYLQFANVVKVVLVFREQWWPKKNFGFIHAFRERIPTWWSDPRGLILTGWAGGPKADALLNHSPDELEKLALKTLAKLFSERVPTLRAQLLASHTFNWARDPHIRGAYSYLPVNGLDLPKLLAAPVAETLYFAGEATVVDAQTGIVSGAFKSGLRAANQLLMRSETLQPPAAIPVPAPGSV